MGTHPIFESDFDCLTVLDMEDAMLTALPEWKKNPRPYVTTQTIEKHIGDYVTVLGQVKSMDGEKIMIHDGTGNIAVSLNFAEDDEKITDGAFIQITGKATSPSEIASSSEEIYAVQGEEGTLELRAKVCKLLDQHPELFYAQ